MGMFDYFTPNGDLRFVCSEGHPIASLQTKDFDCELDVLEVVEVVDGTLMRHRGMLTSNRGNVEPVTGSTSAEVYGDCEQCPVVIRAWTSDGCIQRRRIEVWVEFDIVIIDGSIQSVTRKTPSTAEHLAEHLKHEDAIGPMSPARATHLMEDEEALRLIRWPTIDDLLKEFGDSYYTREQFEADRARLLARLCAKHGITESEVDTLIREHNYTHSAEDPEDEYIGIMSMARAAGWV